MKFFIRGVVFFFPIVFIGAVYEVILFNSGECRPISHIVDHQLENPELVWRRQVFSQFSETYKFYLLKRARKQIVVTGSSRTLGFSKILFPNMEDRFINAGRLVTKLGDIESIIKCFEDSTLPKPKVFILGLDPWWLRGDVPLRSGFQAERMPEDAWSPGAHVSAITRMIIDGTLPLGFFYEKNNDQTPYCKKPALGLAAILIGSGFRSDGSTVHESIYYEFRNNPDYVYKDRETPPIIDRVRNRTGQFASSSDICKNKVNFLVRQLEKIKSLGIEVHIFLPPFSDEVSKAVENDAELKKWWDSYWNDLPLLLRKNEFYTFGFKSPNELGLDDRYMYDGFHPSEVLVGNIMIKWLENIPKKSLLSGIDIETLKQKLRSPSTLPVGFGCNDD